MEKKKIIYSGIEMKSREWAELLQEPYRSQMIANLERGGDDIYNATSMHQALNMFNWERTKEGRLYWKDIDRQIAMYEQNIPGNLAHKYINSNIFQLF